MTFSNIAWEDVVSLGMIFGLLETRIRIINSSQSAIWSCLGNTLNLSLLCINHSKISLVLEMQNKCSSVNCRESKKSSAFPVDWLYFMRIPMGRSSVYWYWGKKDVFLFNLVSKFRSFHPLDLIFVCWVSKDFITILAKINEDWGLESNCKSLPHRGKLRGVNLSQFLSISIWRL